MKKKLMRSATCFLLCLFLCVPCFAEGVSSVSLAIPAELTSESLNLSCKSAILMEAKTGTVLYEQNPDKALPPASVTKVMTLLLIMEAIDSGILHLEDTVTASANAASMGGSQIYLKEGETMTVEDLLKSVVLSSANDAAVALAERVAGSVTSFVEKMNQKAKKIGMEHTKFENVTGLDDTAVEHLSSARDIAVMSRELIRHETVLRYSSLWMDTVRNGAFGLTNTNRLVRYYKGCTGLKTGSTSKAGFCVSVTATRDGMTLIAVIMGAESRDVRNAAATELLDWGFANFALFETEAKEQAAIRVIGGKETFAKTKSVGFSAVVPKADLQSVRSKTEIKEAVEAPTAAGDPAGVITYSIGERIVGEENIEIGESVPKITLFDVIFLTLKKIVRR